MFMAPLCYLSKSECQRVRNIYKFKNFLMIRNPPRSFTSNPICSAEPDDKDNIILQSDLAGQVDKKYVLWQRLEARTTRRPHPCRQGTGPSKLTYVQCSLETCDSRLINSHKYSCLQTHYLFHHIL